MTIDRFAVSALLAAAATAPAAFADAVIFAGAGDDAQVTATINAFRAAVGGLNPNVPGSFGAGRREINWDDVPDSLAAPHAFPGDFFNANSAGRARGVEFRSLAGGLQVSADSDNPTGTPANFANVNPQFGQLFRPRSAPRMFAPVGFVTALEFFVPGTSMPASVNALGVVFCDVDRADDSAISFFGPNGQELATVRPPAASTSNGGLSFVGVLFNGGERIAHVGILSGNVPIDGTRSEGQFEIFADAVVLDDFVFGEPVALPAACPGDIDANGAVELGDLSTLLSSFGACIGQTAFNPTAELTGDTCADLADLAVLLANFGRTCD